MVLVINFPFTYFNYSSLTNHIIIIVGLALIGGIITWLNRRGGCTSRTKRNKDGLSHDDYTIDMHQNDFNNTNHNMGGAGGMGGGNAAALAAGGVAAGAGAGIIGSNVAGHQSTEPLSPFERRYAPAGGPGYVEPYADYHEGYSQAGYSQGGYSQEGFNSQGGYSQEYPPQQPQHAGADYGYYDTGYNQAGGYDYYDPAAAGAAAQQQKHYSDITSPTSVGNLSETGGYTSSKPNVYESKPNEL